jgi:hypothetical protein
MKFSRRDVFTGVGGSALAAWSAPSLAWPVLTSLPFGQSAARNSPFMNNALVSDPSFNAYASTLLNGFTPQFSLWRNIRWKCAMGSVWNAALDHCWRVTPNKSRFELHNTTGDRAKSDTTNVRRSEIHANNYPLPNGVSLWGAYSFLDHKWADPLGMARLQGGAHAQMHMPAGGSPAFAFRRDRNGNFLVTTNGANDPTNNHPWYKAALSFDQVHDVVFRCLIDPVRGELDVWLDRVKIVSLRGVSIGQATAGCYWCVGLYYTGGISCPIISERANHVFPSTASLANRTLSSPPWPNA